MSKKDIPPPPPPPNRIISDDISTPTWLKVMPVVLICGVIAVAIFLPEINNSMACQ